MSTMDADADAPSSAHAAQVSSKDADGPDPDLAPALAPAPVALAYRTMDADAPAPAPSPSPVASTRTTSDDAFVDAPDTFPTPPPLPLTTSSSTLRRRPRRAKSLKEHDQVLSPSASVASTLTAAEEPVKNKPDSSEATSAAPEDSTVTAADEPINGEPASSEATSALRSPTPPEEEVDKKDSSSSSSSSEEEAVARDDRPTTAPPGILESLAVLVIKAVMFQVSTLIACLTFPFRLLQWWYLFVTDPLGSARRAREWALGAVEQTAGVVTTQLGGSEGVGRIAGRLAWGSLWAVYVCVVLCALLIMAFLGGGLLVGRMVEEPVQVTETLNFDYTKPSPVAYVPVPRLVPPHQRMQLEVSLTLPESDYNRRLGVFQVIRLKMMGVKEAFEPITGVRIMLEQRAEFSTGAGIPEIYAASLLLEAELPLFKRLLWNWRWTLFVWSSMGFFTFELLFALICCRPCIFPRGGQNDVAP